MKKTFSARRVPRKIGGDDDVDQGSDHGSGQESEESAVRRPSSIAKARKSSSLRMSFGPSETNDDSNSAFTPKKSSLSRIAIERNSERKPGSEVADRPSYNRDYLAELKSATPSRPVKTKTSDGNAEAENAIEAVERSTRALDIASKFGPGSLVTTSKGSIIPTDTEIREKKERRARLAKEQAADFISLDHDDDQDDGEFRDRRLIVRAEEKYPETRIVHDDEDVAEGFDEFTEDGQISLGRKSEREAARRKRQEMVDMIAQAEGSQASDSDDSEADRNAAYEAAQTRAGTYGERKTGFRGAGHNDRSEVPPKIAPVPELSSVLAHWRENLAQMNEAQKAKEIRLDELKREKQELEEREAWIQSQLKEAGERYAKLREEAGIDGVNGSTSTTSDGKMILDRGLESLGVATIRGGTPSGGADTDGHVGN